MEKYKKGKGAGGQKGIDYQVKIIALFALEGLFANAEWKLSTENMDCDKFDDVVYQSSDGDLLVQCKHKDNLQVVAEKEVLSVHPKNDDFSSAKYFLSYLKLKDKFTNAFFFVCTNTNIEIRECFSKIDKNEFTYFPKLGKCYKLNVSSNTLEECVEKYNKNNPKNIDARPHTRPEANDISAFLKIFYYISIDDKSLDQYITNLIENLSKKFKIEFSTAHFIQEMNRWFMDTNGVYLKKSYVKAFLFEYINKKSVEKLKTYKIQFTRLHLPDKQILHSTAGEDILLKMSRLYQELLTKYKPENILIIEQINDHTSDLVLKQLIDVFELPRYTFLIIVTNEMIDNEITNYLQALVKGSTFKRVFILSKQYFHTENVHEINFTVGFNDLEDSCKRDVLQTKCKFQGNKMTICSMLDSNKELIDDEMLMKFATNHIIDIESLDRVIYSMLTIANKIIDEEMMMKFAANHKIDIESLKKVIYSMLDGANVIIDKEMLMKFATNHKIDMESLKKAIYLMLDSANEIIDEEMLMKFATNHKIDIESLKNAIYSMLDSYNDIVDVDMLIKLATKHEIEIEFTKMLDSADVKIEKKLMKFATDYKIDIEFLKNAICSMLDDANEIIDEEMLMNFATKQKIEIESIIGDSLATTYLYTKRDFIQPNKVISEKDVGLAIVNGKSKLILISDIAGMGKSTMLTRLESIVKQHSNCFVVRISLNLHTEILKDFNNNKSKEKPMQLEHFFKIQITQITTVQKRLFQLRKKVILMVDAVDEISPEYTDIVLDFLKESLERKNIRTIVVTTRVHLQKQLEKMFHVKAIKFKPLSEIDQIRLLCSYWKTSLRFQSKYDKKCEEYAKMLLKYLKDSIGYQVRSLVGIPLQTIMIADIFQSGQYCNWIGCEEYIKSEKRVVFTKKINMEILYSMFIERKRQIFIENKCNTQGNDVAIDACNTKFKYLMKIHQTLALKVLFNDQTSKLFSVLRDTSVDGDNNDKNIMKMGILQQSEGRITFVHKTFAEYFVALAIKNELKHGNDSMNELLGTIFLADGYGMIRCFIECFLEDLKLKDDILVTLKQSVLDIQWGANTNFECLAREGCLEILKLISEDNPSIKGMLNVRDYMRKTAIHHAVEHLPVIKFLVQLGVDINTQNNIGLTAVHEAAMLKEISVVKFLVEHGADIKINDNSGNSLLHIAAYVNSIELVQISLKEIDLNVQNSVGSTALHEAVSYKSLDVIQFLVDKKCDINKKDGTGRTALHCATWLNSPENLISAIIEYLIDEGADVNYTFSDYNYFDIYDNNYFDIYDNNYFDIYDNRSFKGINKVTLLHRAARRGFMKLVKYLISEKGVEDSPDSAGSRTLHYATFFRNPLELITFLSQHGCDINARDEKGLSALHLAAIYGRSDIAEYLILQNAAPDIRTKKGENALHFALLPYIHVDINLIRVLIIDGGCDVNARNINGRTPLHGYVASSAIKRKKYSLKEKDVSSDMVELRAVSNDILDISKFLINRGFDVLSKDKNGMTLLHVAAEIDSDDIVEYLVEKNVELNSRNWSGRTALHIAAQNGSSSVANILKRLGVDESIRDNNGETALDIAIKFGRELFPFIPKKSIIHEESGGTTLADVLFIRQ